MKILRTIAELRAWRASVAKDATVGLVPTMGALHAGHLSLVALSRARTQYTVMTVFVNPIQFGPKEDFSRYPRPFERDAELAEAAGVDALFAPELTEMYARDSSTFVVEESVSAPLCGAFRPGHFRGVATIVLKLFHLVQPTHAFFGQKDAQQCAVIERMVRDLDVPVELIRGETLREADGLALSSRNIYLSAADRERAPRIYQSLKAVAEAYSRGVRSARVLESTGRAALEADPAFRIQYYEVREWGTLAAIDEVSSSGALVAVAAYLGETRLIDNLRLG